MLHGIEKPRAQDLAHQRLLDRGQLEEAADQAAHELVVQAEGIVEKLVLQCAPLQALQQDTLEGRFGMDDPPAPFVESAGAGLALQGADSAAETDFGIDPGDLSGSARLLIWDIRHHGDGLDGTDLGALAAADAGGIVDLGNEGGGDHAVGITGLTDAEQGITAALATVADEGDVLLNVVGIEYQSQLA